jgi:hypothetical protein
MWISFHKEAISMSDSIPPLSLADLRNILKNPNFKTYLVLGEDGDTAWDLAIAAQNMLAGVRSYLIKPSAHGEVRSDFGIPDPQIAAYFGRGDHVQSTLSRGEAEDFLTVVSRINES